MWHFTGSTFVQYKKLVFLCQSHFAIDLDCCIITIHICFNEFWLIDLIFYCNILEREKQNSNQVQKVFWTWVSLNCNSEYLIKCFIFSISCLLKNRHNANINALITFFFVLPLLQKALIHLYVSYKVFISVDTPLLFIKLLQPFYIV